MHAARTASGDRLVLRAHLSEIERPPAWIERIAGRAGLATETTFALQLCVEEAIANIIMYSGAPEEARISVDLMLDSGRVVVVIEDGGRPFDPTGLPPRVKPASLHESRIGELGVHLMRQYSSSMRYRRLDGRNRLTLTFDAKSPAART
jgi:anti-sigma regulatory factor (Ser/Thr protein kinase)